MVAKFGFESTTLPYAFCFPGCSTFQFSCFLPTLGGSLKIHLNRHYGNLKYYSFMNLTSYTQAPSAEIKPGALLSPQDDTPCFSLLPSHPSHTYFSAINSVIFALELHLNDALLQLATFTWHAFEIYSGLLCTGRLFPLLNGSQVGDYRAVSLPALMLIHILVVSILQLL